MDVAEMISDLGDHGFEDTDQDTKVRMLQDAIWDIEGRRPWPFLEQSIDLTFDGTSGLAGNFPANFRTVLKMTNAASGIAINPVHVADVEEYAGAQLLTQVAPPQVYYAEGEQMKLWPVPPAGTVVRMRFLRYSPAIVANSAASAILIPVRHHRAIVLGALVRLYDMEDDVELSQRFQGHYEERVERMVEDIFRKQLDRPDHIRVTDPDSWHYDI